MRISKSPLAKLRGKPVPIVVSLSTLPIQTAHMTIYRWKAEAPFAGVETETQAASLLGRLSGL